MNFISRIAAVFGTVIGLCKVWLEFHSPIFDPIGFFSGVLLASVCVAFFFETLNRNERD